MLDVLSKTGQGPSPLLWNVTFDIVGNSKRSKVLLMVPWHTKINSLDKIQIKIALSPLL